MKQNAFSFLLQLQQLQNEIMADEIQNLEFGSLTFSSFDTSVYFNNILIESLPSDDQVLYSEKLWRKRNRPSTFYFENCESTAEIQTYLTSTGYEQSFEDCWMFHQGTGIDSSRFMEVKEVTTVQELDSFMHVLDGSFQENDPQNPYGKLGGYLQIARSAWLKFQGQNRLRYFIAFKLGAPVAVSALTCYQGLGYISNVGTLQKVRGEGYGKLITLFAVDQSVRNGNNLHFLGTEEGHYPHVFYERIGFVTKYRAVGWSKVL